MTVYYNRILKCAVSIVVLAAMFLASLSYSGGMAYAADDKSVPYVMTIYNEQNGLPTGEANTILQTADGYIWIGSYGGLIRYDGSVFRNYSVENAITSSSIRSLFEDSKGRLWIGTNDTGVIMMEKDVFTAIASPEDHSFLCIRDFAEDDNGRIYVASNSGMAEVTGDTLSPIDAHEVKGNAVYNVAVDSYDRVWGCMNNGECAVVKEGKLVGVVNSNDYLSGSEVYSVAADSSGNIVMGTSSDKVMVLSFKSDSLDKADVEVSTFSTDGIITHNSVNVDKSGDILVSGINGLAVIAQDGSVTRFGEAQKAVSANISICDYENNFWLASTSYGVIKYTLGCFTSPNTVAELENISVNAIAISKGYHYIGTDTGLIICDENWHRVENELTEMYSGIRIRCVIKDRNDNIWIASYSDFAAVCYDPDDGSVMKYSSANGLAGDKSRVIYELSDGRIAVGTQSGVNIIVNGIITEKYTYDDGMINPSVLCFAEGDEGQIYVGSDGNGIYEIKDGQVINHGFNDGLGEGVVLRMLRNSDGGGWFASVGSSLYYWDTVTFKRITNFDKSAGSIFEFYDINGMLWILQNNGITAVDKQQLLSGEQTDCIHYGFSHGMTGSLNANTWNWLGDDGKLYMATRNGISVFGFRGVDNSLPNITVNSVKVDGVMLEHPLELHLNSNAQRITIDFSALSYTDTTELRIAYCLRGFDKDVVVDSGKNGSVSYTNLPGGSYTFEVMVYNPENPEVTTTFSLPVRKAKKLTEHTLFWSLAIITALAVACGIAFLATRTHINRIRRRQQEYKSIVEQSLLTFANTIDAKDPYTNGHSMRVAQYSREIAKRMGMTEDQQENIYYVALMHDIGKIGVPDQILKKPGRLTEEEREIIQKHVEIGGEILKDFNTVAGISQGATYHHERYDGKGYTKGLSGEEIPLIARIIGVADTYDAMSSDRCYRKALDKDVITEEFIRCSGTQFDPDIVPYILEMIEEGTVPITYDAKK